MRRERLAVFGPRPRAPRHEPAESVDLRTAELAGGPGLQVVDAQAGVAAAVQPAHRVPDCRQHPLHLVLSPLVKGELDPVGTEAPGARGRGAPVVEIDALREPGERVIRRPTFDLRDVDL